MKDTTLLAEYVDQRIQSPTMKAIPSPVEYMVASNFLAIYSLWDDQEVSSTYAHIAKVAFNSSKWALFFNDRYLGADCTSLELPHWSIRKVSDLDVAFHFDSKESAIAAWEQFKTANNFKRYQELIDVAIALELNTEPHEFDPIEYAGCLEEGSLIQLPEPTVFALYFRNGELEVLNYSLMVFLKKENCTEADLDQAIAYFTNLQQQSADQAKKILLSV